MVLVAGVYSNSLWPFESCFIFLLFFCFTSNIYFGTFGCSLYYSWGCLWKAMLSNTNSITEIKNFVIICYSSPSCSCSSLVIVSSHLHWFYFSIKSLVLHFNYTYKLKFSLESEPLVLIAQCAVSFTFRDRISCCEGYLIWNMHCMFNIAFLFCTSRCFAYLLYTSPAVCL